MRLPIFHLPDPKAMAREDVRIFLLEQKRELQMLAAAAKPRIVGDRKRSEAAHKEKQMPELPQEAIDSPTVTAIYAAYVASAEATAHQSRRLGASVVGKICPRAVWYDFRHCGREKFEGRMLRLFETGHNEEARIARNLQDIGAEVHLADPATNEQFTLTAIGGHFVDKLDAVCAGLPEAPKTWHVCEFKTHNHKSFTAIKNGGVKKPSRNTTPN